MSRISCEPYQEPTRRPSSCVSTASRRSVCRRAIVAGLGTFAGVFVLVAGTASASTPPAPVGGVPASFSGFAQAFAIRIEADEPLPAGSGDIPSVTGLMTSADNTDSGVVAVDQLGATTGPKVVDPTGNGPSGLYDPQAACSYPSTQQSQATSYPVDGANQQTAQSQITCAGGPSVTGMAYSADVGGNAGVTNPGMLAAAPLPPLGDNGVAFGTENLGPNPTTGDAVATATANVTNFALPGVFSVAAVQATGTSEASGLPGSAASAAHVTISDLKVGPAEISLSDGGVSLGSGAPVPLSSAQGLVNQFNQLAAPFNCTLTLLLNPKSYPQGPLFERPLLPNQVAVNGTAAGSTAAGFGLQCLVPQNLNPTNFSPLMLQIFFGFVGTQVYASTTSTTYGSTGSLGAGTGGMVPSVPMTQMTGGSTSGFGGTGGPSVIGPVNAGTTPGETRGPGTGALVTSGRIGQLVGVDTALERAGGLLAVLAGIAATLLLGPWRLPVVASGPEFNSDEVRER